MKRSWWVAGLASCLSLAVGSAYAHDVQLNFKGKVTPTTCVVDSAQDITLDNVSVSALKATGDVASIRPFAINVSGCDGTKLGARFNAPANDIDIETGALVNAEPGGSTVQIQILDREYKGINLADMYSGETIKPNYADDMSADFNFYAQYLAAAEKVTAGDVSAKLMFDLVYE